MFESLDEQIKLDEHKASSNTERLIRWALIVLLSVVVFGGLYFGVHLMRELKERPALQAASAIRTVSSSSQRDWSSLNPGLA